MWDRQTDIQVFRFLNCLLLSQIARLTHLSHWVCAASLAAVNTALPLVSPVRDVLLKIQLCWFTNLNFLIVLIMATFASLILQEVTFHKDKWKAIGLIQILKW